MQNNADLTSMVLVNQNISWQIQRHMVEFRALLNNVNSLRLEFHETLVAARAIRNKFRRVINSIREMETDLLRKEDLLLRRAEWVQTMNITIKQTEPKTTEQIMELMFVTDLMEHVEWEWDAIQESRGFYKGFSRHLESLFQQTPWAKMNLSPQDDVVDAAQDRQSIDSDAQISDGMTEDMEDDSEDESEEGTEEETDEGME
ncbi:hypothetical protein MKX07_005888 [Trichoderma sp. CBMAI-0711]|uniref:Uncharacterized protein n=1 Tax=Trichoderma parareesei TaxID=858221 RepID=A0A2H2YZW4_TRIPA|nr:hypothetical protein MKX07_005888 [Trichoderma sp. CBMAI-0711]OTA01289.1 hypothetical protein A9Z42_0016070 [Trichoderma parareesei]